MAVYPEGSDSPVQDGLSATVQVIEFLFGDRVIDIHGWDTQFPSLGQLVQPAGRKDTSDTVPLDTLELCTQQSKRNPNQHHAPEKDRTTVTS